MANLIHKTGDIFTSHAKGIGHGVNIDGVMGSGIAVQFKARFPDMYEQYRVLCKQHALQAGTSFVYEAKPGLFVYNIASQDRPGPSASYEWLQNGVQSALIHASRNGIKAIALPRIGSGIGGLDERQVEFILNRLTLAGPVDIELWTLPR